jgi:hypothetical protein
MPEKLNVVRESYANKRNARTLLVANVSIERVDYREIIFYRTDMLGKRCTHFAIAPFLHRKNNLTSRCLLSPFLEMSDLTKLPHYHVLTFPV